MQRVLVLGSQYDGYTYPLLLHVLLCFPLLVIHMLLYLLRITLKYDTFELWHCRLGHASVGKIKHILFLSSCPVSSSICFICPKGKQHKKFFLHSTIKTSRAFELLHVDNWGPFHLSTTHGHRYFLSIVDDFSRATWCYLLSYKSNAFVMLKSFVTFEENQFHASVHIIRSDNGIEFCDSTAISF